MNGTPDFSLWKILYERLSGNVPRKTKTCIRSSSLLVGKIVKGRNSSEMKRLRFVILVLNKGKEHGPNNRQFTARVCPYAYALTFLFFVEGVN